MGGWGGESQIIDRQSCNTIWLPLPFCILMVHKSNKYSYSNSILYNMQPRICKKKRVKEAKQKIINVV